MSVLKKLDDDLKGAPNNALTVILVVIAIITLLIAFFGGPTSKAVIAAWLIAP